LLEYNYIVVPPPNEFCECISSCGRRAKIPHKLLVYTNHDWKNRWRGRRRRLKAKKPRKMNTNIALYSKNACK
jgi:hypothetical protein